MKQEKAVIYYRVSTEEQARNGVSLDQQKKNCQNYAEQNEISIAEIFHDDGASAKTINRKGLQNLLTYCSKHHKDLSYVIVYKIDRLSRNMNDYSSIDLMLKKLDIQLISSTESINESPTGKFIGHIMAANAQLDNDIKAERVSNCMMEKFDQGKWYGRAPLGYLNGKDSMQQKTIVTDPQKSHLVKHIFIEYAKGFRTLESIRIDVNEKGLTTSQGNPISGQMMTKIISNTFYYGLMYSKKHEKYNIGIHEPLVSEEIFLTCQNRLRTKGNPTSKVVKKNVSKKFPLRHNVKCAFCLRPLTGGPSKSKTGKLHYYYRCYNKECGSLKSIAAHKMHDSFLSLLSDLVPSEKSLDTLRKALLDAWQKEYNNITEDRRKAEKQLLALDKEKDEIITLARKQIFTDDEIKEMMDDLRLRTLQMQRRASASHDSTFDMDNAINKIFPLLQDLPTLWKESDYEDRKVLQGLIFVESPSYDGNGFTTPQLSLILEESKALEGAKSTRVAFKFYKWNTIEQAIIEFLEKVKFLQVRGYV